MGVWLQLALEALLSCASRMDEKGPESISRYEYTQSARMPAMALNLPFWTTGRSDDDMTDRKEVFLCRSRMRT